MGFAHSSSASEEDALAAEDDLAQYVRLLIREVGRRARREARVAGGG